MTGEQVRPFLEQNLHVPCGKHKPTEEPQAGSNKQQRFPQTHLPGSRILLKWISQDRILRWLSLMFLQISPHYHHELWESSISTEIKPELT